MNRNEAQITLDWLYDILGESYALCNTDVWNGDLISTVRCSKCKLSKINNKYQLELVLPNKTLLINQSDFKGVAAKMVHFSDEEDSIILHYKDDSTTKYTIEIIPVKRVPIPDSIIESSKWYNNSRVCISG